VEGTARRLADEIKGLPEEDLVFLAEMACYLRRARRPPGK
jgi:hypothetical protein